MKKYSNIVVAGFIWLAQAFCGDTDASLFINRLPHDRQKDMRITQSYSPACALPGRTGDVFNGQMTTVWFRATQAELDTSAIVDYYTDGGK